MSATAREKSTGIEAVIGFALDCHVAGDPAADAAPLAIALLYADAPGVPSLSGAPSHGISAQPAPMLAAA